MKRKTIISLLCLTMGLSIVACGKQENTATTESVQSETTVTDDTEPRMICLKENLRLSVLN